ncbi:MAG: Rha family transcriptional regulator [Desulfovibrionaceae bacterium]
MSMSQNLNLPVSIEFLSDERPAVRSLELAQHFGVKHSHVIRDIKLLMSKLPKYFTGSNFGLSEYQDSTGRTLPCFLLTRDAFTLLVMGWSSARAIEWKLRYIAAFNALEAAAMENARVLARAEAAAALGGLTPTQRTILDKALSYRQKGLSAVETAKLLDVCPDTVRRALRQAARAGLVPGVTVTDGGRACAREAI